MSAELQSAMEQSRSQFWAYALSAALVVAGIILLPEKKGYDPDYRLILVLAFFGALLTLCWSAMQPLREYLRCASDWRYQDAHPTLKRTADLWVDSVATYANQWASLLMALFALLMVWVLSFWPAFDFLQEWRSFAGWLVWVAVAALLFFLIHCPRLGEIWQLERLLQQQTQILDFQPMTEDVAQQRQALAAGPAVTVLGERRFRAGGFDWQWEDFTKSCMVFGQTGSGKTVCVLNALLEGLIASAAHARQAAGALILDPKGDFCAKIQVLAQRYQQTSRLFILDPHPEALAASLKAGYREYQARVIAHWNPFDSPDEALELAGRFVAVLRTLGMVGGDDPFWANAARDFLQHAIELIRASNPPDDPPNFEQVYALIFDQEKTVQRIEQADLNPATLQRVDEYFTHTWWGMSDRTRSGIQGLLTNMISPFRTAPYNRFFSGKSSIRLGAILDEGGLFYMHMPVAEREMMARTIGTLIKLEFFREVLRRPGKMRPSFFLCDEFQSFFTVGGDRGDADFFERSRQSRHANIVATQNLSGLFRQAGEKQAVVDSLLGNCAVKIFLRNTDSKTNDYAAKLFGEKHFDVVNVQFNNPPGAWKGFCPQGQSYTTHPQRVPLLPPEIFPALAIPSHVDYTETVVHLGTRTQVRAEKLRWKIHPILP